MLNFPETGTHPMTVLRFPLAVATLLVCTSAGRAADPAAVEFFEKNVRPVLVEQCLACHDAKKAKGELRLDTREGLLKGGQGGAVVVPGKPKESRLLVALRHTDETLK